MRQSRQGLDTAWSDGHASGLEGATGDGGSNVAVIVGNRGHLLDLTNGKFGFGNDRLPSRAADDQVGFDFRNLA
jgi:hypothetical protein